MKNTAFSDAIGHSMVDYLIAFAENYDTEEAYEEKRRKHAHAQPFTKESPALSGNFRKYGSRRGGMIVGFRILNREWESCNVSDISAGILANCGDNGQ